ncbi:MAG: hypothetical protein ABI323_08030 [Solirubrobacteraceae bacterium]
MYPGPPRRRRARPVADASLDALLDRSEDLAKGWLLALLEQAPLDDAPRILATDLTRDGPRVCEALLRAIGSDADQHRLEPDGPLAPLAGRVGELAGAAGARDTAQAVDALQAVVWSALRAELRDPDPELVSQLAERLAQVSAIMRAAALRHGETLATAESPGPVLSAVPRPGGEPGGRAGSEGALVGSEGAVAAPGPPEVAPQPSEARWPPAAAPSPPATASRPGAAAPPSRPAASLPCPGAPEPHLRAWMSHEPAAAEPAALWVGALREEIQRTGTAPLSLLLAELEDAERVLAVESEPTTTFNEFTHALRRAVRRQDILVCETHSRAWVIARDTGRSGARSLVERITRAVHDSPPWRGAPPLASVGFAVLGEDGRTPAELIEAAEEDRFVSSAGGAV